METMRDAFFTALFPLAQADPEIMVLATDFSAPSFDRWRRELPGQFLNTGVAEQNSLLVAAGLALEGMKVFVTGIAPFITMRCFEQIRLYPADMNLNLAIVGVGAGFSYLEAGATHHAVEDLGLMSLLPNMRVLSPSGNAQVRSFPRRILEQGGPWYLRLDRYALPEFHRTGTVFGHCLAALTPPAPAAFLATGAMVESAWEMRAELALEGLEAAVVDAFALPLDEKEFEAVFAETELIISLEEHVAAGGLGAAARTLLSKDGRPGRRLESFALDLNRGLCHSYGSRQILRARHGLAPEAIKSAVRDFFGRGLAERSQN